jgi:hypothetical protein
VINDCIAICCRVVMYVYRSSQLRGKRTYPPGSACYNKISCDSSHVVTYRFTSSSHILLLVRTKLRRCLRMIISYSVGTWLAKTLFSTALNDSTTSDITGISRSFDSLFNLKAQRPPLLEKAYSSRLGNLSNRWLSNWTRIVNNLPV